MLGGWASGSKYSFLGAMRAAAQLISYEVAQGLSIVGVVMMVGSLSLTEDRPAAGATLLVRSSRSSSASSIFLVAGFAETNRPPFDLAEADAELVGGYNTEYGGGALRGVLRGRVPQRRRRLRHHGDALLRRLDAAVRLDPPTWVDPIVVLVKILIAVFFFIWVRATLPRLRYDQLMSFGWKILLPLATLNALVTAILVVVLD